MAFDGPFIAASATSLLDAPKEAAESNIAAQDQSTRRANMVRSLCRTFLYCCGDLFLLEQITAVRK